MIGSCPVAGAAFGLFHGEVNGRGMIYLRFAGCLQVGGWYRVKMSAAIMDDRVSRYSPSVYYSEYLFGEGRDISLESGECEDVLLPRC